MKTLKMTRAEIKNETPTIPEPPVWYPAGGWRDDPSDVWHVPTELRADYAALPAPTFEEQSRWGTYWADWNRPKMQVDPMGPLPEGLENRHIGGGNVTSGNLMKPLNGTDHVPAGTLAYAWFSRSEAGFRLARHAESLHNASCEKRAREGREQWHRENHATCPVCLGEVSLNDCSSFEIVGPDPDGRSRRVHTHPGTCGAELERALTEAAGSALVDGVSLGERATAIVAANPGRWSRLGSKPLLPVGPFVIG